MTHEREADQEWLDERRAVLLRQITSQRPARLKHAGELDVEIAAWGKRLVAGEAGNLLLGGPTGTGKTWAMWEVLHRAVEAGFGGRILFASAALWRETIAPPVDHAELRAMRTADFLVFDDLGSGRIGEWEKECLLGVIDERWANGRPIGITFNVKSLRETLGERIASRLADGATRVALKGNDRRRTR